MQYKNCLLIGNRYTLLISSASPRHLAHITHRYQIKGIRDNPKTLCHELRRAFCGVNDIL